MPETTSQPAAETLKIKLLQDLPVHPKHGAFKGNVYNAEMVKHWQRGGVRYWIIGAVGEPVGVMNHEADLVTDIREGQCNE